jgi:hypothetical protein
LGLIWRAELMTKISGISLLTEARGHIAAGWVQGRFF